MKRIGFVLILVALLAVACGGDGGEAKTTDLLVVATDIDYDTPRLEAATNQPVRLTLVNDGALEHDFSVRKIGVRDVHAPEGEHDDHMMSEPAHELDLHVAAAPGGSALLEFTPTEPGEYEFYCTVPGHKEAGMVGTLVIAP